MSTQQECTGFRKWLDWQGGVFLKLKFGRRKTHLQSLVIYYTNRTLFQTPCCHCFQNRDARRVLWGTEWKTTHIYKERNRSANYLLHCVDQGGRKFQCDNFRRTLWIFEVSIISLRMPCQLQGYWQNKQQKSISFDEFIYLKSYY